MTYRQPQDMTDRELLLVIVHTVKRLDRAMWGNGRRGLVERVAALESSSTGPVTSRAGSGTITKVVAGAATVLTTVVLVLWRLL